MISFPVQEITRLGKLPAPALLHCFIPLTSEATIPVTESSVPLKAEKSTHIPPESVAHWLAELVAQCSPESVAHMGCDELAVYVGAIKGSYLSCGLVFVHLRLPLLHPAIFTQLRRVFLEPATISFWPNNARE